MRIKLDENLGGRGRELFTAAGHEVATVGDQGLAGAVDRRVIEVCGAERRCLVTLDLDFSNPFVFLPERYAGIAVLRPRRTSLTSSTRPWRPSSPRSAEGRSRGSSGPSNATTFLNTSE